MATASDLASYVARVRSQYIDVDGVFGAQCWDQWSHYASAFLGVPSWPTYTNAGGTHPHAGYACNVHHNAARSGLAQWFEILPATASPRPGDVAFWEFGSTWYPLSHVATVLDVTHGGRMLRCLTQNPGAVQIADLTTSGLIGYLRPRALTIGSVITDRTPTLTASEKEALMAGNTGIYFTRGGKLWRKIFNTDSGWDHEYWLPGSALVDFDNKVAAAFRTGSFLKVDESHAKVITEANAAVRAGRA